MFATPHAQTIMNVVCPHCGAKNRVPDDRLGDAPDCGACHRTLLPPGPVAIRGATLPRFVAGTDLPIVVDFWAEWCGPCKMMAPEFAKAATQRPDLRFVKVDTEDGPDASARYAIRSIPTLALFHGGRELARVSGAMRASQLLDWIDQHLK
jgi:thioredoxin 2